MTGAVLYAALVATDLVSGGSVYDRPFKTMESCEATIASVKAALPPAPEGFFYVIGCDLPRKVR